MGEWVLMRPGEFFKGKFSHNPEIKRIPTRKQQQKYIEDREKYVKEDWFPILLTFPKILEWIRKENILVMKTTIFTLGAQTNQTAIKK